MSQSSKYRRVTFADTHNNDHRLDCCVPHFHYIFTRKNNC